MVSAREPEGLMGLEQDEEVNLVILPAHRL